MRLMLSIVAQHAVDFNNRSREEITEEIVGRLNGITLLNREYHLQKALTQWQSDPHLYGPFTHDREWRYREFFVNYLGWLIDERWDTNYCITGPYGLRFDIDKKYLAMDLDYMDYDTWFTMDEQKQPELVRERTIWRTLFCQLTRALGGSELIYIGSYFDEDHEPLSAEDFARAQERYDELKNLYTPEQIADMYDPPDRQDVEFVLQQFLDCDSNYEGLKKEITHNMGPPAPTMAHVGRNLHTSWYVDRFEDLVLPEWK